MTRAVDTPLAAEVQKTDDLQPFFAVAIGLPEPVYAWSVPGTISFGGRTYLGVGSFGSIEPVGEASDGSAIGFRMSLSGIDPSLEEDILTQPYRGAPFELYVGACDASWTQIVGTPKRLVKMLIDSVEIVEGDTLTISLGAESRMRDQGRPRTTRNTDAEQQRRHPGDRYFEFLPGLQDVTIVWGRE